MCMRACMAYRGVLACFRGGHALKHTLVCKRHPTHLWAALLRLRTPLEQVDRHKPAQLGTIGVGVLALSEPCGVE